MIKQVRMRERAKEQITDFVCREMQPVTWWLLLQSEGFMRSLSPTDHRVWTIFSRRCVHADVQGRQQKEGSNSSKTFWKTLQRIKEALALALSHGNKTDRSDRVVMQSLKGVCSVVSRGPTTWLIVLNVRINDLISRDMLMSCPAHVLT